MAIVKTSAKGQIVIPAAIRKAIGLEPGQKVRVEARNGEIVIKPLPKDPIAALVGLCQGGPSLIKALLKNRQEELRFEAQERARHLRRHDDS